MSELKITGKIEQIKQVKEGISKAGKDWKKVEFVITNNEGYQGKSQMFAFEVYGEKRVDPFLKFNKVGDIVEVSFNIKCNQHEERHYITLDAWNIFKVK